MKDKKISDKEKEQLESLAMKFIRKLSLGYDELTCMVRDFDMGIAYRHRDRRDDADYNYGLSADYLESFADQELPSPGYAMKMLVEFNTENKDKNDEKYFDDNVWLNINSLPGPNSRLLNVKYTFPFEKRKSDTIHSVLMSGLFERIDELEIFSYEGFFSTNKDLKEKELGHVATLNFISSIKEADSVVEALGKWDHFLQEYRTIVNGAPQYF